MKSRFLFLVSLIFLAACSPAPTQALIPPTVTYILIPTETPTETVTPSPVYTPTISPTATPDTRPLPRDWSSWPTYPKVSARAVEIYRSGLELGVTPNTFSTVGDCQSEPEVFMGIYGTDRNPIGEDDPGLLETINMFYDSFQHDSVAVRDGLSAPSVLDPLWTDTTRCEATESPLTCELRLYKPMIVFVNLGTNWRADASVDVYETYLRQIVDEIIAGGAVPILTNKADNVEGNYGINRVTAQVAYDYDIPYMNFWIITNTLPDHGLDMLRDPAGVYLTPGGADVRSFVALKTLETVWRGLATTP